jgi:hypothetical protein
MHSDHYIGKMHSGNYKGSLNFQIFQYNLQNAQNAKNSLYQVKTLYNELKSLAYIVLQVCLVTNIASICSLVVTNLLIHIGLIFF